MINEEKIITLLEQVLEELKASRKDIAGSATETWAQKQLDDAEERRQWSIASDDF